MTDKFTIKDAGPSRKYFSQLPHLVLDLKISPNALMLYLHLKRILGDSGSDLEIGTRKLSEITGISIGSISAAKKELIKKNLISIFANEDDSRMPDSIRITDIWPENMRKYSGVQDMNASVQNMNTLSELAVFNMNASVQNMNDLNNHDKEQKNKEEDVLPNEYAPPSAFASANTQQEFQSSSLGKISDASPINGNGKSESKKKKEPKFSVGQKVFQEVFTRLPKSDFTSHFDQAVFDKSEEFVKARLTEWRDRGYSTTSYKDMLDVIYNDFRDRRAPPANNGQPKVKFSAIDEAVRRLNEIDTAKAKRI